MTPSISDAALGRLKSRQVSVMDDLCNIYEVTFASGTYGTKSTETRTLIASGTPCGIRFTNGQVVQRGQVMLVDYDAVLRIVDTQPIKMTYEIDLVEKGDFLISGTFKPYSAPVVNSTIQKVLLKRQTP